MPQVPESNNKPGSKTSEHLLEGVRHFLRDLTDLYEGLDKEGTVYAIKNNWSMKGANAWMLMCSIMIASLGLDLGSPAVIIGAMLISPLMSPILGIGLGVGTNDIQTFSFSLKEFGLAIAISLVTSTIYFLLTPLGNPTQEIMSRTAPTLLDVLIAFFGGVAGIISTSRKEQTSAIPGVAIATALMPPLCVTGFGIATGNVGIALRSFYLFFLNAFFVALATYLFVRLLGFQQVTLLDEKLEQRKNLIMTVATVLMIVPSAFILAGVIKDTRTSQRVDNFMKDHFKDHLPYIDQWQYIHTDSTDRIVVKVYGSDIEHGPFADYQDDLEKYGLEDVSLDFIPTSEVDLDKVREIETELTNFQEIAKQLTRAREERSTRDRTIDSLAQQIVKITSDTLEFGQISEELKVLFPDLESVGFARMQYSDFDTYARKKPVLIISWPDRKSRTTKRADEATIREYILKRTSLDSVMIISN